MLIIPTSFLYSVHQPWTGSLRTPNPHWCVSLAYGQLQPSDFNLFWRYCAFHSQPSLLLLEVLEGLCLGCEMPQNLEMNVQKRQVISSSTTVRWFHGEDAYSFLITDTHIIMGNNPWQPTNSRVGIRSNEAYQLCLSGTQKNQRCLTYRSRKIKGALSVLEPYLEFCFDVFCLIILGNIVSCFEFSLCHKSYTVCPCV